MGSLAALFAMSGAVFTPIAWKFGIKATSESHSNNTEECGGGPIIEPSIHGEDNRSAQATEDAESIIYFWFMAILLAVVGLMASLIMRREPTVTHPSSLMHELLPVEGDQNDDFDEFDFREEPEIDIYGWDLLTDSRFLLLFFCMLIEDGTAVMFANSIGSMHGAIQHSVN